VRIVERGEDRSLLNLDESEHLLELNLDTLDSDDRQAFVSEIVETFESQHRLFSGDPNKLREATNRVLSEDEIEQTIEFFREYLSGPYIDLLERSLTINRAWRIRRFSSEEMDDYKEDIADDYVEESVGGNYSDAYTAVHMASSGYFNREGYLRDIFTQLDDELDDEYVDYPQVFTTIISESPFLVSVGDNDETRDVISEFVKRLNNSDNYRFNVDFIDGHAQAGWNRETLEEAILVIQRDAETLKYDCSVKPGETIYRLYPGSLSGLSLNQ